LNPFLDAAEYTTAVIYAYPYILRQLFCPFQRACRGWWCRTCLVIDSVLCFCIIGCSGVFFVFYKCIRVNKPRLFCFLASIFSLLPVCATMAQDRWRCFKRQVLIWLSRRLSFILCAVKCAGYKTLFLFIFCVSWHPFNSFAVASICGIFIYSYGRQKNHRECLVNFRRIPGSKNIDMFSGAYWRGSVGNGYA